MPGGARRLVVLAEGARRAASSRSRAIEVERALRGVLGEWLGLQWRKN